MKTKDLISLVVAVVILLVAGYIVLTQLMPKPQGSANGVEVEVVGEIKPNFDEQALTLLSDAEKTRDFSVPVDLTTGLNNTAVFGK